MKRAILIATGTVGGLGAVLAITPPTFTSTSSSPMALPGAGAAPANTSSAPAATPSAAPTKSATAAAPKKSTTKATPTKSASTNNSQSQAPAATQTPTVAPITKAVTGTFTGDVVNVRYGNVQVKITVENGKITDAQAVQAPSGRNDRWTQMAVPILRQQTLQAQSAQINGASGASFTSYGWYTSLVSALAKAGM
jgi:uncharacterized protein with FMN-binding domain